MVWGEEGDLSQPMGPNSLGFCDASFAPTSSRSLQSTLAYYSAGLIAWSATRQGLTTLSTAESELVGITSLFNDLRALEPLVKEIHGGPLTLQMHSDSRAAIAICNTPSTNWRTRHLRIRASYVREALESGLYSLHHVHGTSMKADIGTKALPAPRFHQLVTALGISELAETRQAKLLDVSVEEKVKILLTCLVVASLLEPVEAHSEGARDLGDHDWQFIFGLIVVTICCWEVFKGVCSRVGRCVGFMIERFLQKLIPNAADPSGEEAAPEGPGTPLEAGVHVQYVDDVAVVAPLQELQQRARRAHGEAERRLEGLVRRRRPTGQQFFQFRDADWADWPPVLSIAVQPVGQDRWEYRPAQRTVLFRKYFPTLSPNKKTQA